MFNKPFVVLDLETSGVDPKRDDIIEVAMVRYENGKEVARYDDLIKVGYKLPKIITVITGITDRELEDGGKEQTEVFAEIARVLDGAYLVAHNTQFDHGFLKAKKVKMNLLGVIDTIPLAQILHPTAASYSLESLSDDFGIIHVNKHRAMGDVEATLELFKKLWERTESLSPNVLKQIQQYLKRSTWEGGVIFSEASPGGPNGRPNSAPGGGPNSAPGGGAGNGIRVALGIDEVLAEGGVLSQYWPEFEPRRQQVTMSQNVMTAFQQEYHLICEAPTGVGKSLGYLVPAANVAISNKSKVVISTNTINLQDQLFEKDVPLLQEIYQHATQNSGVRAAMLKGRSHYLCLRRLAKFKERPHFSDQEIILLIKILVWQATTETGDSGEIHLSRPDHLIWNFELCSEKNFCSPQKCKPYGECYLHRARKRAEDADIIIVNHALLCADLEADGGLLPEYNYLVIDEAHHFEDAATQAFGMEIEQDHFILPLKVVRGLLETIQRKYTGTLFGPQLAMERLPDLIESLPALMDKVDNLFSVIAVFVGRNVEETGYVENLMIDKVVLGSEEWLNLTVSVEEVMRDIKTWLKVLSDFVNAFVISDENGEQNEYVSEIEQEEQHLYEQIAAFGHFFVEEFSADYIRWMSSDTQGEVGVHLAPMVAGNRLKERLYDQKKSIILTSATLGVQLQAEGFDQIEQHPFTYIRRMLALDDQFEELILDSPFDFEKQAYVLIPKNIKPVTSPQSTPELKPFFEMLIREVGGSMLCLFTSYRMIETLYLELMEPLQSSGVRLLGQRISGGRNKIMKAYKQDPEHSVLMGTSSFWEGVDIKGEGLTTLVIHKLPFDIPSDPIFKARSQLFANGFFEYSVPRAILKFRQGFGRLIRSQSDYGAMVVLDNRVLEKEYGKLFLKALPDGLLIEEMGLMDIPAKVKEWLDLSKS